MIVVNYRKSNIYKCLFFEIIEPQIFNVCDEIPATFAKK